MSTSIKLAFPGASAAKLFGSVSAAALFDETLDERTAAGGGGDASANRLIGSPIVNSLINKGLVS